MNILNVAYSCDDHYAMQAGTSIKSLLENNKKFEKIRIYLLNNKIGEKNLGKIQNLISRYENAELEIVDMEVIKQKVVVLEEAWISSYGRVFLSSFLKIDKVMYIDCDTIVAGPLDDFWNRNIEQYYAIGVQDTVQEFYKEAIGVSRDYRYINAGILILNLKLWREDSIEKKCIDFINQFKGKVPHNDQGTINAICSEKILIASPKYNLQCPMIGYTCEEIAKLYKMKTYYSQEEIDDAIKNPVIIHYSTFYYGRPWYKNSTHPLKEIFLQYFVPDDWDYEMKEQQFSKNTLLGKKIYDHMPFIFYYLFFKLIYLKNKFKLYKERKK